MLKLLVFLFLLQFLSHVLNQSGTGAYVVTPFKIINEYSNVTRVRNIVGQGGKVIVLLKD